MTDLVTLFSNFDRIALSLERIATALEDGRSYVGEDTAAAGNSAATEGGSKTKRTRRTKEQIAADEAAKAAAAAAASEPVTGVASMDPANIQVTATFQPAPVTAEPAPIPAPVQAVPTAVAPPVMVPPSVVTAAPIVTATPEQQFTQLYQIIAPAFAQGRAEFVQLFGQFGLQTPLSDQNDTSLPGPQFRALTNEHRVLLLQHAQQLASQVLARAGSL